MRKLIPFHRRIQYGYYQILDRMLGRDRSFKLHERTRRNLYQSLHESLRSEETLGIELPIREFQSLSDKGFREQIALGVPFVMRGGAAHWECCRSWSFDLFDQLYGNEEILLVDHEQIESDYEVLRLTDIIQGIRDGMGKYYRFYPLLQRHPERILDFDYEWLLRCRHRFTIGENFQVFMGGLDSYTPLHNAFSCNIFTQVVGQKEWYLYPPEYTLIFDPDPAQNIYRSASYRSGGVFNPFENDFSKHPLYKYMDHHRVVLYPGDILYNPPYWWHAVKNPSDSIGVGYRWFPPLHSLFLAPLYFLLDLTAANPTILESMKLAKTDINLIQLAQTGRLEKYRKELA